MEVTIYIETDIKDPRKGPGRFGYVIEFVKDGKPLTREGFGKMQDATETKLTLTALAEAIGRLTKPCIIKIQTECSALKVGINKGWVFEWQRAGWKTKRGSDVKNADLWQAVFEKASIHALSISDQVNAYKTWLAAEITKHE